MITHKRLGHEISIYTVLALKAAVKLEMLGLRRSGKRRSATMLVKDMLGLPVRTKRKDVLVHLEEALADELDRWRSQINAETNAHYRSLLDGRD